MIIYTSVSLLLLTGFVCVGGLGRPIITYFYIAVQPESCVAWCLHFLGFVELCPAGVIELLASWTGKFSRHRNGVIWNMIPHCLMWSIWWERNTWIFEGTRISNHELKLFSFQNFLGWTNASGVFNFTSLPDLLDSCTFYASQFCCFHVFLGTLLCALVLCI